jgi:hypothetical protein
VNIVHAVVVEVNRVRLRFKDRFHLICVLHSSVTIDVQRNILKIVLLMVKVD